MQLGVKKASENFLKLNAQLHEGYRALEMVFFQLSTANAFLYKVYMKSYINKRNQAFSQRKARRKF
jgi:hypothetical protein